MKHARRGRWTALTLLLVMSALEAASDPGHGEKTPTRSQVVLCLNHVGPEDKPFLPIVLSVGDVPEATLLELLGARRAESARTYLLTPHEMETVLRSIAASGDAPPSLAEASPARQAFELRIWEGSLQRIEWSGTQVARFLSQLDRALLRDDRSVRDRELREALATWRRRLPAANG